ncbi:pentatricopeptide repeat-containing protein At4g31070, mitochondrial [Telopea speciosissima]|uniref:pentatricopeptide repeat-containing protein At4g31070, mitochondrial n=1 Tax=Telopea speciosissima TaxID=54955 RepID=UPI001CC7744E|nr:pentatricopeptide repeat-containing protein At4g31070, mitochondrial [Telopea speciosissima]
MYAQPIKRCILTTQTGKISIRRFTAISNAGPIPTESFFPTEKTIKDLVLEGSFDQALEFYKQLHLYGFNRNGSILLTVIKACSSSQSLLFGLQIHSFVLKIGFDRELITANSLLSMYGKCSHIEYARLMFETMPLRDTITLNSMITCYVRNGYYADSIKMLKEMYSSGFEPKPELVANILSVCGQTGDFRSGKEIHARLILNGCMASSIFLSTALVDMYSRCFNLEAAFHVFNQMKERNEVSWTAMIKGCTENKSYDLSFQAFREMQLEGIKPNRVSLIVVLPACAALGALKQGKEIHAYAFHQRFESESHFAAALIHMYSKCENALGLAMLIFDRLGTRDVVMWSSMIRSCYQIGDGNRAMELFYQMQMEGIKPNSVTLLAIVSASTSLFSIDNGLGVHGYIVKSGLELDVFIGNSLVDMYAKCGCLNASHQIFKEMPTKDSISWSALIHGYGLHGYGTKALELFHKMQQKKFEPDNITFLAVLSACKHSGLIAEGQYLYNDAIRDNKISLTLEHYACYIDLLGRSGKLEDACEIISHMPMEPNATIFSCLSSACKAHGRLEVAEELAYRLLKLEPENVANYTLLCMVYAEAGNWAGVAKVREIVKMRGFRKSSGFSRIEVENRVNSNLN